MRQTADVVAGCRQAGVAVKKLREVCRHRPDHATRHGTGQKHGECFLWNTGEVVLRREMLLTHGWGMTAVV
jgi:hypothetical protein